MNCFHIKSLCFVIVCSLITVTAFARTNQPPLATFTKNQIGAFPIVASKKATPVSFDVNDDKVVRIAAIALSNDIKLITGNAPAIDSLDHLKHYSIILGTIGKSKTIDALIGAGKLNVSKLKGQWETFLISVIDKPFADTRQALIIAGSDARGTAFGVFQLSKMLGIHPFYWWADIAPEHQEEIYVKGSFTSKPPSVKYRGIFINDEDWGLQPWAAKTFEPKTGDIGPKTYTKVFELLLRLKGNLIWPAMHPSTKAFFHYPGNAKVAADYAIVVGSSHAEPMLRNNVDEWDEKKLGHFNYITNKEKVYSYWEERVKQSASVNGLYSMGMRGVHDSKMEGVKDEKEAASLLEKIIADQRGLLRKYIDTNVTRIPQAFTAYKEVLEIYDAGLKIPDDVTLVWPDDNYGYIQRLNSDAEKGRSGGSGVYYHASYWGRPHDYLWLSTTHPSLVQEEMMKAYNNGATKLWVLNVGDIKPLEYNIQQFLDMAYDATPFQNSAYTKTHLTAWATNIFGQSHSEQLASILLQYYQLAFERRPEFMGWSQTEPTTQTALTAYNHFFYGDEAQKRIKQYDLLEKEVKRLRSNIGSDKQDAFYQLIYYPVITASWMNKKFLYHDKAVLYAKQNRLSGVDYAALSKAVYDSIVAETDYYNNRLSNGKWNGIMHMKPRNLPVFQLPAFAEIKLNDTEAWSIAPEGFVQRDSSLTAANSFTLPTFDNVHRQEYFIDVFLSKEQEVKWRATATHPCITLSQRSGALSLQSGKKEKRIWVSIDWNKVLKESFTGELIFSDGDKKIPVAITARRLNNPTLAIYKGFIENNGVVCMYAANFSRQKDIINSQWKVLTNFGYAGSVLQASLNAAIDTTVIQEKSSVAEYDFFTFTSSVATVTVYSLPTHPPHNKFRMRYAVSVDDSPLTVVDFKTFGRSEEWKQNVLRNRAERKISLPFLKAGKHTLKVYAVDPGVVLDEIRIDLGGLKKAYSKIEETKMTSSSPQQMHGKKHGL